jgi:hypothetical protein
MKSITKKTLAVLTGALLASHTVCAKVSEQTAAQLGKSLTPLGATIEGNKEQTIPAWTGSMNGVPPGLNYEGSGHAYPDPYASDKPLFTITAANYQQYADKLTDGQKALFASYPGSFEIPVYPSHRDARYSPLLEERTRWNALNTELVDGIDGLQNYTGGAPFPLPSAGSEVLWNARLNHPTPISDAIYDEVATYANGAQESRRLHSLFESPYAYTDRAVGAVNEDIGKIAAMVFTEVLAPSREKGKMAIVHEPLDYVRYDRNSWIYMPGVKRVRRAPMIGFDTLDGPGGLKTIDENLGFNGSMERYNWTLIGKQEIYIPFHAYRFDQQQLDFSELLPPKHANPDYMRYELHRVWVVEAVLKKNTRHIYAKRRFYINEDSWQIVLTDNYDEHDQLWRVGIFNSLYDYYLQGYISRVHMNHDLLAKAYIATRLVNDTRPTRFDSEPKGERFFSPQNLKRLGRK